MADTSEECQVNNSSGVNLIAIDAYNASDNYTSFTTKNVRTTTKNTAVVYERTLTTQLTSDRSTALPSATINTILLQGFYYDENQHQVYRTLYNLIFADPNSLFPVKNCFEIQDATSLSYAPITLTTADKDQISLAFQFYQLIQAYPTSSMAQGFYDSLIQVASLTTVEEIDTTLTCYFQTLSGYETLDLLSISALWTYIEMYACTWAMNQANMSYYLYTNLTQEESEAAGPVKKVAPHFVGTVVFSKVSPPPDTASLTDYNSAYTITFIDPNPPPDISPSTTLFYYRDQLLSDLPQNNPNPSIRIQGSFVPKSQWTNVETDHQLIPVFYGVVNSQAILGVSVEQNDPNTAWYALWNRVTLKGWIRLSHQYMALRFASFTLVKAAMFKYSQLQSVVSLNKGELASKPQLDEIQADTQKILSRISEGSNQLDEVVADLRQVFAYQFIVQESEIQTDIFISQGKQLKALGQDAGNKNAGTASGETPPVDTSLLKSTAGFLSSTALNLVCALKAYIDAGKAAVCTDDLNAARSNFYQAIRNKDPDLASFAQAYQQALDTCSQSLQPSVNDLKTAVEATRTSISSISSNMAQINSDFAAILSSDTQQVVADTNADIALSLSYEQEVEASGEAIVNGSVDPDAIPANINFFTS